MNASSTASAGRSSRRPSGSIIQEPGSCTGLIPNAASRHGPVAPPSLEELRTGNIHYQAQKIDGGKNYWRNPSSRSRQPSVSNSSTSWLSFTGLNPGRMLSL